MALQGSGQISINDIYNEMVNGGQYEAGGQRSLGALSTAAGKSAPHGMSEFYGYNASGGATTYTASCTFSVRTDGGAGDSMLDQPASIRAKMDVYKNGELEIGMRETGTDSFTFSAGDTLEMYSNAEDEGEISIYHEIFNGTFFYLEETTAADGSVQLSSTITAPANNIEIRFNIR